MKTVIVTGASGGIGSACCRKFLENGYNVTACYFNNESSARELLENCNSSRILLIKADIAKKADCEKIFEETISRFGTADVVVNNAAVSIHGLIQDMTEEELDEIIDINIKGTFRMCSLGAKYMIKKHSGSIVNISSMWGETGASCETAYSMTKAAVSGLTKALAKELGPCGIRVNAVSPGLIDTKMNSCYTQEDLNLISEETPLMRIGTAKEIADSVYYLAGDEASFITGQILGVNGGYVI